MAVVTLGSKSLRSIIKIKENGVDAEYYVAKHNYESGSNGTGKTLLVRRYLMAEMAWHSTRKNAYSGSSIDTWLNNTFLNTIQSDVKSIIPTTTFPYTPGNSVTKLSTLSRKVFLLSGAEIALLRTSGSNYNAEGSELGSFSTDANRIGYLESSISTANDWWLRTPYINADDTDTTKAYRVTTSGRAATSYVDSATSSPRPAFCLPASLLIDDNGYPVFNTAPTVPGSISYSSPEAGKQMTVSWEASTDAEGNAITYTVERQLDSGIFVQVGQTTGLTMPVLVPSDQGATTITIRVKAADSLGLESAYRTGSALTISYNHTPTISGIDGSLGDCTTAPTYTYTVDDEDAGDVLTVEESIETADGLTETLRTFTATRNQQYTVKWNCRCWLVCKPSTNKLIIRVTDSKGSSATRTMTFNRPVGCVSAARAVSTDAMPAKVLLSLYPSPAELPGDCTIEAYVTNNPFDDSPVWEDVSGKLNMTVHTFSNSTAANGYGLGYKFCITRDVETVEFYQAVLRFA